MHEYVKIVKIFKSEANFFLLELSFLLAPTFYSLKRSYSCDNTIDIQTEKPKERNEKKI